MESQGILNLTSLKDQVYEYLRYKMRIGDIKPGSVIDMTATSKKLGISRTPLRDALIQLEMEGFVVIDHSGIGGGGHHQTLAPFVICCSAYCQGALANLPHGSDG